MTAPFDFERLGDLVTFQRGHDLPSRLRRRGSIPLVSSAGVTDWHDTPAAEPPGVVTGRYGTIGELFFIDQPYWPLNTTLYVRDFHGNNPRYIYYLLHRFDFGNFSGKSGVPGVNRNDLHAESVGATRDPLEQAAIVEALDAAADLLSTLDQLLLKKRDLAQGLRQALLSERVRLSGFQGRWNSRRIDELADIVSGGTPSTSRAEYWSGSLPWCTPTDVTGFAGKYLHHTARTISEAGLANSGAEQLPTGALLLCTRATVGDVRIAGRPMCTNQGFKSLVCRPGVNNEFVYYALPTLKSKMLASAFGSTFLELSKRNLGAIELRLPDDEQEQAAIAAVLSDLDLELEALEARRTKTLAIKQGMMQALLTGRIRLT